ncbi:MAG: helix-turn-helix domain-containing protein [Oscillospiraceae bacterium]|nr:helix-turn-helix domain-containing protein [Oscillospiraceae bacterium]
MHFQRIRDLREDADKTQAEIAEYLHMNRVVYRRYENGDREVPVWVVIKLAGYYNTTTDYILGLTNQK